MNTNFNYPTTMYEKDIRRITFPLLIFSKYCKKKFFRHTYIWVEILSYIVVGYLRHPACKNDTNGLEPGSYSKMTDKNAAEYSKTIYVFGSKLICV